MDLRITPDFESQLHCLLALTWVNHLISLSLSIFTTEMLFHRGVGKIKRDNTYKLLGSFRGSAVVSFPLLSLKCWIALSKSTANPFWVELWYYPKHCSTKAHLYVEVGWPSVQVTIRVRPMHGGWALVAIWLKRNPCASDSMCVRSGHSSHELMVTRVC